MVVQEFQSSLDLGGHYAKAFQVVYYMYNTPL